MALTSKTVHSGALTNVPRLPLLLARVSDVFEPLDATAVRPYVIHRGPVAIRDNN